MTSTLAAADGIGVAWIDAIEKKDTARLERLLLQEGAVDVNDCATFAFPVWAWLRSFTPLTWAIKHRNMGALQLLVRSEGVNLEAVCADEWGADKFTPLGLAVELDDAAAVALLLSSGASLDSTFRVYDKRFTAEQYARAFGKARALQALCDYKGQCQVCNTVAATAATAASDTSTAEVAAPASEAVVAPEAATDEVAIGEEASGERVAADAAVPEAIQVAPAPTVESDASDVAVTSSGQATPLPADETEEPAAAESSELSAPTE